MKANFLLISGCVGAMLGVAIGAFGAHALKTILTANQKSEVFETAVKYHFYHSLALLFAGLLHHSLAEAKWVNYAGVCFVSGIIVFSGSLYILSLTNVSKWGAITPIGGLFFLAGWGCCLLAIVKNP